MKILSSRERTIYGVNPVKEALRAKRRFVFIQIQKGREAALRDIIEHARQLSIRIEFLDSHYFDRNLPSGHQGVSARVIDSRNSTIEDLFSVARDSGQLPFFLILDSVQDPRNFGALLRVADAAGVHGVIYQRMRSTSFSVTASKASAGAIEHVNLIETANIKNIMTRLTEQGLTLIAADQDANKTLWETDLVVPLALVIGSEGEGLRQTVARLCHQSIKIPMFGNINSLNVSVATAVLCFEVLRQRSMR